MSIKDKVKEILEKEGKIDNFRCIDERITTRLSDVILHLGREGMKFDEEKSGYIEGTKNWRYVLQVKEKLF